jgi:hypothetical protein
MENTSSVLVGFYKPAPSDVVEKLPLITIEAASTEESSNFENECLDAEKCPICTEPIKLGSQVIQLPCGH